jgi:hypothetical protein
VRFSSSTKPSVRYALVARASVPQEKKKSNEKEEEMAVALRARH